MKGDNEKIGWNDLKSSKKNSSWYRRHRDAIASNKMKIRGAKSRSNFMTAEEKKIAIMERIRKLKAQKEEKQMKKEQQQQNHQQQQQNGVKNEIAA